MANQSGFLLAPISWQVISPFQLDMTACNKSPLLRASSYLPRCVETALKHLIPSCDREGPQHTLNKISGQGLDAFKVLHNLQRRTATPPSPTPSPLPHSHAWQVKPDNVPACSDSKRPTAPAHTATGWGRLRAEPRQRKPAPQ